MKLILQFFFLALIVLFGLELHVHNPELVTINYFIGETQLPVSLLMTGCTLLGAILGIIASLGFVYSWWRRLNEMKQRLKSLHQTTGV